ncbi:MAG: RDD family protein [Limisphaerales bacterium]
MNWYYVDQGKQAGPVNDAQFAELVRTGKILPDTLVWREGLAAWQSYREAITPSPSFSLPPGAGVGAATGESPDAVCAECGKMFAMQDMIRHGGVYICANCKPVFMQKIAEGARINTNELNYAGFWIRFAAKFVDGLILGLPFLVVFFLVLIPQIRSGTPKPEQFSFLPLMVQFAFIFIQMAYQIFFLGKYGATPGKMLCKLKVVTAEGGPIGYGRATGRFFAEMLSGMACYIGYIMVAFDSQKRALHDYICNTRVIYK